MLEQKSVFASFCLLVILPMAVFALACLAFAGYVDLKMPLHTIIMLSILMGFALCFAPQNEFCQGAKLFKNKALFEVKLNEYLKDHSLKFAGEVKANANFDVFFQDFLQKLKPVNFSHIASSVFPMLGILGTFISIAISMPDFSASNSELELEISKLLSGIATAFYVSIYGIFLSIWWMIAARMGRTKVEKFYQLAKAANEQRFWQANSLQVAYLQRSFELNERSLAIFNLLNETDFFQKLQSLSDHKLQSFSKLLENLEHISSAQSKLAERAYLLGAQNLELTQKAFVEFIQQQKDLMNDFAKRQDQLNQTISNLQDSYAQEQEFSSLEFLKDDINKLNSEAKDLLEKISQRE